MVIDPLSFCGREEGWGHGHRPPPFVWKRGDVVWPHTAFCLEALHSVWVEEEGVVMVIDPLSFCGKGEGSGRGHTQPPYTLSLVWKT